MIDKNRLINIDMVLDGEINADNIKLMEIDSYPDGDEIRLSLYLMDGSTAHSIAILDTDEFIEAVEYAKNNPENE